MSLIGKDVRLKNSPNTVEISKADNKGIYLDFGNGKPIFVSYDKCELLLILDETLKAELLEESRKYHEPEGKQKKPGVRKEGTENIAFKITYCDGGETDTNFGFREACSEICRKENLKLGRAWCNEARNLCTQLENNLISEEEFERRSKQEVLCYESRILIDWKAYAGYDNAKNPPRPRKFNQLCSTGIALLTTVPNDQEDRLIFGLFKIAKYFEGSEDQEGYVETHPKYRIEFTKEEAKQMRFWDFYSNKNSDKETWGTGLFRYLSNEQILEVLKRMLEVKEGKQDYELAKELTEVFCNEKNLQI